MPIPRRAAPYFGQPDYRIYELNKRLQQRTEDSDNLWWDAFATEFFEDDATLTLTFCLEDGLKRYSKFIIIILSLFFTHILFFTVFINGGSTASDFICTVL